MHLSSLLLLALRSFSSSVTTSSIQTSGDLPKYALVYAPVIHLWSQEDFWPSDPSIHLQNVTAKRGDSNNDTAAPYPLTIANLNYPNSSADTYLTGNDDVETEPEWLRSTYGKPDPLGKSEAPSAIIAIDKVSYLTFLAVQSYIGGSFAERSDWPRIRRYILPIVL
jgi:hypothetical protein